MSFYTDASLVLIPSGVKNQKVYSAKPIDGSGDLTFSRASNATRVNSSGLVEKVRQNLALYSNTFSDALWTKLAASVTGGQTGYDGSSNAWLLENNSGTFTTTRLQQLISLSSSTYTFSIYAKAGTTDIMRILIWDGATSRQTWFNFTTAAFGNTASLVSTFAENIGGGWFRISITAQSAVASAAVYPTDASGSSFADAGDNIYIQNAQLETGDIATDYIATTSAAVSVGPVSGLPRLDYSGGASCPSLLLEPQRTNYLFPSEQINQWVGGSTTIVANVGISPSGYQDADSITFSSGGYWYKSTSLTYTTGQTFVWSIYVNTSTRVIQWGGATPAGTSTYEIVDAGNGWYRQILTRTTSGSGTGGFQTLMDSVYIGVGVEFKIWGAQLEAGAYATSYIPTLGASVTRLGDMVGKSAFPTSILNTTTAHSGFFELKPNAIETSGFQVFGFDNNTYSSYIKIYADTTGRHRMAASSGGSSGVSAWGVANQYNKFAWSYDGAGNVKFFCNGVASVNYSITLNAMTEFGAGEKSLQTNYTSQSFKQILLFNSKLTDAQLAELTTL